jgi:dihydroneopterin aldolase
MRRIVVRDLVMPCSIGVYAHEEHQKQRVRINLELDVVESTAPVQDRLANVVNYDDIIRAVRRAVDDGHIRLIETLAERIAALCLQDARVRLALITVEKLDVYSDVAAVGISIERLNRLPNPA